AAVARSWRRSRPWRRGGRSRWIAPLPTSRQRPSARRPRRRPTRARSSVPKRLSGRASEACRVRHRCPAGESLADVDGGLAVDELLALEERHLVGGAEGDDGAWIPVRECRTGDLGVARPDDRELARRRKMEVERDERPPERRRNAAHRRREEAQHRL